MNRLDAIRKAQEITDRVFAAILLEIKPGMTEESLAKRIEQLMRTFGGDRHPAFKTLVCSGKRTALFHGPTSKKKIKNHEIVYIDLGAKYHGWCSDMTRTFFIGKPHKKLAKIYSVVLKTQLKQLAMVKAGAKVADIDRAGRNYLKRFKLDKHFIHTTGHGLGKKVHQKPKISYKSGATLKIGDVVTIEPGVYLKGVGGIRIEDLVVVTKKGCENLSRSSKKIITL